MRPLDSLFVKLSIFCLDSRDNFIIKQIKFKKNIYIMLKNKQLYNLSPIKQKWQIIRLHIGYILCQITFWILYKRSKIFCQSICHITIMTNNWKKFKQNKIKCNKVVLSTLRLPIFCTGDQESDDDEDDVEIK